MQESGRTDASASLLRKLLKIGFGFGGLVGLAIGVWMFLGPLHWAEVFPARIDDFAPVNPHFVRDLGGWYVAGGVLMLFALTNAKRFGGVALVVLLIANLTHAASHVADTVSGRVGAEHWLIDFPFVYAPLIVLLILLWIWWTLQAEDHPDPVEEEPEAEAGGVFTD